MATMQVPDCVVMTKAGPLGCLVDAEAVENRAAANPNGFIDLRVLVQMPTGETQEKPARLRSDSIIAII